MDMTQTLRSEQRQTEVVGAPKPDAIGTSSAPSPWLSAPVSYTHLDVYKRQTMRQGMPTRSFSVDFENHGDTFAGNGAHKAWDLPYVRDFVAHVGCNHSEIVLDSGALNDDEVNRCLLYTSRCV